jgi:hypothetical protein
MPQMENAEKEFVFGFDFVLSPPYHLGGPPKKRRKKIDVNG